MAAPAARTVATAARDDDAPIQMTASVNWGSLKLSSMRFLARGFRFLLDSYTASS